MTMNKILKIIYIKLIKTYKNNPYAFFTLISGFALIFIIRSILASLETIFIADEYPFQRILFMISSALLVIGIEIGYRKQIFLFLDKKSLKVSNIFNHFNLLGQYSIASIIFIFTILIFSFLPTLLYVYNKLGVQFADIVNQSFNDPYFENLISAYFNSNDIIIMLLLCLIPSIYIWIRLFFWNYFIVDKNFTAIKSLKASWQLTKGNEFNILVLTILLFSINILGVLTIVGIFITPPISCLFISEYFRTIVNKQ